MMDVTAGTKLPDGTIVLKGDPHNMKRMRCMGCQGETAPHLTREGKKVLRCTSCGRIWTSSTF